MAGCALTQGYVLDCKDSVGGVAVFWVIEKSSIKTLTATAGVVTALTFQTGKHFFKYELPKETASYKDDLQANVANGTTFYQPEVQIALNKMQTATRNELMLLIKNLVVVIIKDANGKLWMVGKDRGLDATGGGAMAGTASGDRNGYTITLTGKEPELAIEVSSTLEASLETPGT